MAEKKRKKKKKSPIASGLLGNPWHLSKWGWKDGEGSELIRRDSLTNIFQGQVNVCADNGLLQRLVAFIIYYKITHAQSMRSPKVSQNVSQTFQIELPRLFVMINIALISPYSLTVFTSAPLGRQLTFTLNKMPCCCPSCTQQDAHCVRLPIKQVHMTLDSRQAGWWDVARPPLPSCGCLRNKYQSLIYSENNKTYHIMGGKILYFLMFHDGGCCGINTTLWFDSLPRTEPCCVEMPFSQSSRGHPDGTHARQTQACGESNLKVLQNSLFISYN